MPGSVDTPLRNSALDAPAKVLGKRKSAMDPTFCAQQIILAADARRRDLYLPWFYFIAVVLHHFIPSTIDLFAAKKYTLDQYFPLFLT